MMLQEAEAQVQISESSGSLMSICQFLTKREVLRLQLVSKRFYHNVVPQVLRQCPSLSTFDEVALVTSRPRKLVQVALPSSGDHSTQDESHESQSKIKTTNGLDLVGTHAHHICSLQINSDEPWKHCQSSFKSLIFVNDADENVAVYTTNLVNDQSLTRSRRQADSKPSCQGVKSAVSLQTTLDVNGNSIKFSAFFELTKGKTWMAFFGAGRQVFAFGIVASSKQLSIVKMQVLACQNQVTSLYATETAEDQISLVCGQFAGYVDIYQYPKGKVAHLLAHNNKAGGQDELDISSLSWRTSTRIAHSGAIYQVGEIKGKDSALFMASQRGLHIYSLKPAKNPDAADEKVELIKLQTFLSGKFVSRVLQISPSDFLVSTGSGCSVWKNSSVQLELLSLANVLTSSPSQEGVEHSEIKIELKDSSKSLSGSCTDLCPLFTSGHDGFAKYALARFPTAWFVIVPKEQRSFQFPDQVAFPLEEMTSPSANLISFADGDNHELMYCTTTRSGIDASSETDNSSTQDSVASTVTSKIHSLSLSQQFKLALDWHCE